MQGQSPYIYNLRLGYDNKNSGLTSTLLFNIFGKRISKVGVRGLPDQYEQPVERLDWVTLYKINDTFKISFKAQNLLDPDYKVTQSGATAFSYKRGRKFSLGIDAKF
jgi:outer membrane receptor protein involved in Fe transport